MTRETAPHETTPTAERPAPGVSLAPIGPFGVQVTAREPASVADLDAAWLRSLTLRHRIVSLRGFDRLDKAALAAAAGRLGDLLEWDFGFVLDVVEHERPVNYIFTRGNAPWHWDGAFARQVPGFLFFQCLEAPAPGHGGETTFCDSPGVIAAATPSQRARWEAIEIVYRTEKRVHYGGEIRQKLVDRHPVTGESILRFAEPLNAQSVDLNPLFLEIRQDGRTLSQEDSERFLEDFIPLLYAKDVLYAHAWGEGDFVLADNHALLHGRNAYFDGGRRHLQRVHVI